MSYPKITDAELSGKRVFLRADLNVPIHDGKILDDKRMRAVLPTISYILEKGASVIIASHLDRPGGKSVPELSLFPFAERLHRILDCKVTFAPDCVGSRVKTLADALKPGEILLLENLRFHPEEEDNDPVFAGELAALADIYVNDAFGTCHRSHASMVGVPEILGGGYIGFLIKKELRIFGLILKNPARPLTLILGGAKVSDKVPVINNLLMHLDYILIGGGMLFTFLKARGYEIGTSLLEEDRVETAAEIIGKTAELRVNFRLATDVVAASTPDAGSDLTVVPIDSIPEDKAGFDIGPSTIDIFTEIIRKSRTIVWNGPMGMFENKPFDKGTLEIANAVADATITGAFTIIGGGDSARAVNEAGLADEVTFVSTGGGASLKLLQGKELPALKVLKGVEK